MVDEHVTDGRRIAEFLSSELTGLSTGPLGEVSVVDAEPDLTPTESGSYTYTVEYADRPVGRVEVEPEVAVFQLPKPPEDRIVADHDGLSTMADGQGLRIERASAVKGAVDVFVAALED